MVLLLLLLFIFSGLVVTSFIKNVSLCIMGFTGTSPYPTLAAFVQTERRCILGYEEEKVLDEARMVFMCVVKKIQLLLRVEI